MTRVRPSVPFLTAEMPVQLSSWESHWMDSVGRFVTERHQLTVQAGVRDRTGALQASLHSLRCSLTTPLKTVIIIIDYLWSLVRARGAYKAGPTDARIYHIYTRDKH